MSINHVLLLLDIVVIRLSLAQGGWRDGRGKSIERSIFVFFKGVLG
jgi:hypothetical protein